MRYRSRRAPPRTDCDSDQCRVHRLITMTRGWSATDRRTISTPIADRAEWSPVVTPKTPMPRGFDHPDQERAHADPGRGGRDLLPTAVDVAAGRLGPGASLEAVSVLRTGTFIAGGTAHVLALGVFVTLVSRLPTTSKPVRVLGTKDRTHD
jgi:hypothetical protein